MSIRCAESPLWNPQSKQVDPYSILFPVLKSVEYYWWIYTPSLRSPYWYQRCWSYMQLPHSPTKRFSRGARPAELKQSDCESRPWWFTRKGSICCDSKVFPWSWRSKTHHSDTFDINLWENQHMAQNLCMVMHQVVCNNTDNTLRVPTRLLRPPLRRRLPSRQHEAKHHSCTGDAHSGEHQGETAAKNLANTEQGEDREAKATNLKGVLLKTEAACDCGSSCPSSRRFWSVRFAKLWSTEGITSRSIFQ